MPLKTLKSKLARPDNREFIGASLVAFTVRILGALAGFVATFCIARGLGAEESGYYFLAFSIVSVLAAVSRGGMDNTIIRFVAASPEQASGVYRNATIFALLLSLTVAGILVLGAEFFSYRVFDKPALAPVLRAMALGILGLGLFTLAANALQGLRHVAASIFILNIAINLALVLAVMGAGISTATMLGYAYTVSAVLIAVLGSSLFFYYLPVQSAEKVNWKAMLESALPLWAVVVMSQLAQWSGQFVAGAYLPSTDVAQLAVAQRTAMLSSFVLIAINLVVAPRFAAFYKAGQLEELASLAKKAVMMTSLLALPIIALMMLAPGFIMGLFGSDFVHGARLLQILAVGQFVNVITGSVGFLLMMSGHEKDMRNVTLVSGTLALILTWYLTAKFGVTGAASGTAIAVATQNLLAVYFVKKRLGFNTLAVWRR